MGNIIGILSTVILVSTLVTLLFAVFAYIASRRPREKQQSKAMSKHHTEAPDLQMSPELPDDFVLRMHEIPSYTENSLSTADRKNTPFKSSLQRNKPSANTPQHKREKSS